MAPHILPDKYINQEQIGVGGMGVIYKAFDRDVGREVAIKLIDSQLSSDPSFTDLLKNEALNMGRLKHENIVMLLHAETSYRPPFLVMEYCPGRNLRDILRKGPRLSLLEVVNLSHQLAVALAYAHAKGIIHKDIKPANILVDSMQKVKLTDFGIAAALDRAKITFSKGVMGTPDYMSPEQAHGQEVDGRSDLYSLGVVMYEMLTGQSPYGTSSGTAILRKLRENPKELDLEFPRHVRSDVQRIVRDLVRRDPDNRKPNNSEMLATQLNEIAALLQLSESEDEKPTKHHPIPDEAPPVRPDPHPKPDLPADSPPWEPDQDPGEHSNKGSFPPMLWVTGSVLIVVVIGWIVYKADIRVTPPSPEPDDNQAVVQQLKAQEEQRSALAVSVHEASDRLQVGLATTECPSLKQQLNETYRQYEDAAREVNRLGLELKHEPVTFSRPAQLDMECEKPKSVSRVVPPPKSTPVATGATLKPRPQTPKDTAPPPPVPTPAQSKFGLKVWTNKPDGRFYAGEQLTVYVQSERDAYLKLDYCQANGALAQLVPNIHRGQLHLLAGETHTIGDALDPEKIVIREPYGKETITAITGVQEFKLEADEDKSAGNCQDRPRGVEMTSSATAAVGLHTESRAVGE